MPATQLRVLGIMGSPRKKGNTSLLLARVLEGAASEGAVTDTIVLAGLDIRECDGCTRCWQGKECPKRDDMNGLYPRIIESDALVFGTPVYWYGPTALMKAFLDRFVYFNCPENRVRIRGKAAALAVPFEEEEPAAAELVVALFERSFRYLELDFVGSVLAPGAGAVGEVLKQPAVLEEAYALGRRLVAACRERGGPAAAKEAR